MGGFNHTPGPWQTRGDRFVQAVGGTDTYSGAVWGAIVHCLDCVETDGEGRTWSTSGAPEANARLIATAPDMLEALRDARHALKDAAASGDMTAAEALISVTAAIAKAEG